MDFFRPGLNRLELCQIRATNTISVRVVQQLKYMNDRTNNALVAMPNLAVDAKEKSKDNTMRMIFTDFYNDADIGNDKLIAVPEISIDKLKKYQQRIAKCEIVSDEDATLQSIVNNYTKLITLHHLANAMIYKTLLSKNQLGYWRDLKGSTASKIIYGLQNLPWKAYAIVAKTCQRVRETSSELQSIRRLCRLAIDSFKDVALRSTGNIKGNFVVKNSGFRFFKVPLSTLDEEIRGKIDGLNSLLDNYYRDMGLILNSTSEDTNIVAEILRTSETDLSAQLDAIKAFDQDSSVVYNYFPPGFLGRYWPLLLLLINFGPSTTLSIWNNRQEIINWVKLHFLDTVIGFWNNWIVKPVGDMLSILRDDNHMTIASKESLHSDLHSLERMVHEYMKDNKVDVSPQEVHSAVSKGDLTMMMSQYENDIRTPYKSIIKGLLIRSILIQIQKTKVDGDLAINGIDRLIKLQQLLFGVLSISPSLFILYQANQALKNKSSLQADLDSRRMDCLRSFNLIEKLVNREQSEEKLISDGKLFMEIVNLMVMSKNLIPSKFMSDFQLDLNALTIASSDENQVPAKGMINRIWNMYSPYFRK